jgi:carbonic anhydrase/acetyltransferase-like protein (isoleucine patch superfamily)
MPDQPVVGRTIDRQGADGPLFALEGLTPRVAASAFVAPTAAVVGDVEIGEQVGVWFHCVLRGDVNVIRVGARSNLQDGTVVHVARDFPCVIGEDVTIGHGVILHACRLHDRAFVGMGATVLDGAVIEEGGMLAAGGLLTPRKRIGPNELWAGAPAKLQRVMDADERSHFDRNAVIYVSLAARYRRGLHPIG